MVAYRHENPRVEPDKRRDIKTVGHQVGFSGEIRQDRDYWVETLELRDNNAPYDAQSGDKSAIEHANRDTYEELQKVFANFRAERDLN